MAEALRRGAICIVMAWERWIAIAMSIDNLLGRLRYRVNGVRNMSIGHVIVASRHRDIKIIIGFDFSTKVA